MRILCTGPEASGTRLLSRIIRACPVVDEAVHKSQPNGGAWLRMDRHNCDRYAVIVRDPEFTARAAKAAGHCATLVEARDRRERAAAMLAEQLDPARSDVFWCDYEDLVANPVAVIDRMARWLGCDPWDFDEEIFDGNAKYRKTAKAKPATDDDGEAPTVEASVTLAVDDDPGE